MDSDRTSATCSHVILFEVVRNRKDSFVRMQNKQPNVSTAKYRHLICSGVWWSALVLFALQTALVVSATETVSKSEAVHFFPGWIPG